MVQYSSDGPENQTENSLFMVQNVRYSNGRPSHFRYSDQSGIQVFGIQMVTVFKWWCAYWTEKGLFIAKNFMYSNGWPGNVITF